jgi:uncharacterized RDD family membrane protein YckC
MPKAASRYGRSMHRHPWRRLVAWLIDWMCVLAWCAIVAAVGIPLYLAGVTRDIDEVALNVVAAITVVVPATLGLAALEAGRLHGTLGKRALGIRVIGVPARNTAGGAGAGEFAAGAPFGAAVLRNALKIALPWIIGHAAVIALVSTSTGGTTSGSAPAWVWVLTLAAYVLPIVYVVALFVRRGRTPYDAASRTAVVRAFGS